MRTDHPDPAERDQLTADDLALAEYVDEYLATPAGPARERFWTLAVDQLGPVSACRLNTAIGLYEALASPTDHNPNRRS